MTAVLAQPARRGVISDNAMKVLKQRYLEPNESVDGMFRRVANYRVSLARLVVAPLVSLAILTLLPLPSYEMRMALLIAASCPVGSNVAVYAQLHDSDYAYAVETVVISVLLSIVTIPVVVGLANALWL